MNMMNVPAKSVVLTYFKDKWPFIVIGALSIIAFAYSFAMFYNQQRWCDDKPAGTKQVNEYCQKKFLRDCSTNTIRTIEQCGVVAEEFCVVKICGDAE